MQSTKSSNQANQPAPTSPHSRARLKTVGNNMGLTQAYELRNLSAETALELKDAPYGESETKASRAQAICALVRAWSEAVSSIRILRGKPLPGSLRPIAKPKRTKHISSTPSEEPSNPSS